MPNKRRKVSHPRGSMLTQQDPLGALTSIRVKVTRSEPNRIDDSQSSTRLLTNASGVVTDSYAYRAFGTDWQSGNGSRNSYRYVGQYGYYRDSAVVQYVRARYLDVKAGRWVSRDPIGFHGGDWNLYRYVENEPMMGSDGSGLMLQIQSFANKIPNIAHLFSSRGRCRNHKTYQCPTTSNVGICGPKIDTLLTNTLNLVIKKFNALSALQQYERCLQVYSPSSWDIDGLTNQRDDTNCSYAWIRNAFPTCGSGNNKCSSTVSVGGQCFHPYTVNYVLFGLMFGLCGKSSYEMVQLITSWKSVYKWNDLTGAVQWAKAGYAGWPSSGTPTSTLTATCADKCGIMKTNPLCSALGNNHFRVFWPSSLVDYKYFVDCV